MAIHCGGLVEWQGKLVSRCDLDYELRGEPLWLHVFYYIDFFAVLLIISGVFVWFSIGAFKSLKAKEPKSLSTFICSIFLSIFFFVGAIAMGLEIYHSVSSY